MEKTYAAADIKAMDRLQRINFVNTLSGPRSVHLVGTTDGRGRHNLALFNSLVHISASPARLGFVIRPLTVARHTYHNIKAMGHFTLNQVPAPLIAQAHQTSAKYPAEVSEFEACGLTPRFTDAVRAPYVAECPIRIGMHLVEEVHIKVNDSWLLIGELIEALLPEDAISASGHIDPAQWDSLAVAGLDTYYRLQWLERRGYARPS